MKLSLITCVYNTSHQYLEECLASIRASSLSTTDYEIIFVDDGSSVDYSDIISKYNVKYIKTENQGLLASRMYGLKYANGDYIAFVDSDDTVSCNYHLPMLHAAEKYNADIVMNGWAFHTKRGKRCCIKDTSMSANIDITHKTNLLFYTSQRGTDHSLYVQWNKLFKKSVLFETLKQISKTDVLTRKITFGEDVFLNFFNFKNAHRIVSINSGFYFYRIHSDQSVVVTGEARLRSYVDSMSYIFSAMRQNVNPLDTDVLKNINEWAALMSRTHYSIARAEGYVSLYPYIAKKYGVSKLRLSLLKDSKVYIASELLGENYDEIDEALYTLYKTGNTKVIYGGRSYYQHRIVSSYAKLYEKDVSIGNGIYIPKKKNKLIDKIIHNRLLYSIGCIIFKKGSKIRAFLKNHL